MSFFAFLLFILLLLLILPALLLQKLAGWWRRATGQEQNPRYSYYNRSRDYDRQQPKQRARKKKIFNKNEGEYVDFEEIATTTTESQSTNVSYETEEQVSDAEWTEIK
ncbi:MAG: DUF4834 family protein [Muribaculum sp.]|nr:DUF4834 family protein [Muribaculum sp.]